MQKFDRLTNFQLGLSTIFYIAYLFVSSLAIFHQCLLIISSFFSSKVLLTISCSVPTWAAPSESLPSIGVSASFRSLFARTLHSSLLSASCRVSLRSLTASTGLTFCHLQAPLNAVSSRPSFSLPALFTPLGNFLSVSLFGELARPPSVLFRTCLFTESDALQPNPS